MKTLIAAATAAMLFAAPALADGPMDDGHYETTIGNTVYHIDCDGERTLAMWVERGPTAYDAPGTTHMTGLDGRHPSTSDIRSLVIDHAPGSAKACHESIGN